MLLATFYESTIVGLFMIIEISVVVIAAALVLILIRLYSLSIRIEDSMRRFEDFLSRIENDIRPIIYDIRNVMNDVRSIVQTAREGTKRVDYVINRLVGPFQTLSILLKALRVGLNTFFEKGIGTRKGHTERNEDSTPH